MPKKSFLIFPLLSWLKPVLRPGSVDRRTGPPTEMHIVEYSKKNSKSAKAHKLAIRRYKKIACCARVSSHNHKYRQARKTISPEVQIAFLTHVLRAFRGNSVTASGTTAIPSSPTSHTVHAHARPGGTPASPETLGRSKGLGKGLAPLTSSSSSVVVVSTPEALWWERAVSLWARQTLLTGQVEQEGLLTVHTVAPSSIKACQKRAVREHRGYIL